MSPEREMRILVAGVGNAWLRDDGFGGEVARRLAEREMPAGRGGDGRRHRGTRPRLRGDARLRRARDRRRQPPGRRARHAVRDGGGRGVGRRRRSRTARPSTRTAWTPRPCCASCKSIGAWPGQGDGDRVRACGCRGTGLRPLRAGAGRGRPGRGAGGGDDRRAPRGRPYGRGVTACTSCPSAARSSTPSSSTRTGAGSRSSA